MNVNIINWSSPRLSLRIVFSKAVGGKFKWPKQQYNYSPIPVTGSTAESHPNQESYPFFLALIKKYASAERNMNKRLHLIIIRSKFCFVKNHTLYGILYYCYKSEFFFSWATDYVFISVNKLSRTRADRFTAEYCVMLMMGGRWSKRQGLALRRRIANGPTRISARKMRRRGVLKACNIVANQLMPPRRDGNG